MNQPVLDLSKLTDYLHVVLQSTADVKNILEAQCEEAKFALAPWQIETITRKEIDRNSCTCVAVISSEDHVREIASEIDRAVAHARKLREKLATNIAEEKKIARRPNVQQIYAPGFQKSESKTKFLEIKQKAGKANGKIHTVVGELSSDKKDNKTGIKNTGPQRLGIKKQSKNSEKYDEANRQSCLELKQILEPKKIADKKLVGTSPYNSLVAALKSGEQTKKNFIAANKSSIKNINKTVKSAAKSNSQNNNLRQDSEGSCPATKSLDSSVSRVQSSAEFENLISKISLDAENGLMKSSANLSEKNFCPIHDKNAPKFIEEKNYTSFDVTEGLDRFGVPPELVKILKVYHSYLNTQSAPKPSDNRGDKAVNRFLEKFDIMNKERRKASYRKKLDDLCEDFMPVFKKSWSKKIDFIELSRLKISYTDLDSIYKSLEIRNISPTKRKLSNMFENRSVKNHSERMRSWKLNSVWNEACIENFEGMSPVRCLRYSSKNQLLELFKLIQRFQQQNYQTSLVNLLLSEVLPLVRNSLDPKSEEYATAYKMISIISDLLYLKIPVLVRTDK